MDLARRRGNTIHLSGHFDVRTCAVCGWVTYLFETTTRLATESIILEESSSEPNISGYNTRTQSSAPDYFEQFFDVWNMCFSRFCASAAQFPGRSRIGHLLYCYVRTAPLTLILEKVKSTAQTPFCANSLNVSFKLFEAPAPMGV